ncbi:MAG: alanine racemase [Acidobacteriota bacterium]
MQKKIHVIEIEKFRPTWAEIDLDSLIFNVKLIQRKVGRSRIFPVIKASAYGHGTVEVCSALEKFNFDYLCVALLEEAIELRKAGFRLPLLILGPLEKYQLEDAIRFRLTPSAYRMDILEEIEKVASKSKRRISFHVKIDTGMGRLGFLPREAESIAAMIKRFRFARLEGVFSNFSSADEPSKSATKDQLKVFLDFLSVIRRNGIYIRISHLANSAGILNFPESYLDAVRPGLLIYGINPTSSPEKLNVKPVMSLRSRIVSLKDYEKNSPIGYSARFFTKRKSRIAVLPIGYDDGLVRALSPGGEVIIHGRKAPIVGSVSMDLITVDVTGINRVGLGDVATIIGSDSTETITVTELARKVGTIPYEIFCGLGRRIPRIYIQNHKPISISSFMLLRQA